MTANEWQELIESKVSPEAQTKVACTIWWYYVETPKFKTTAWFRDKLDRYTADCEVSRDQLSFELTKIGVRDDYIKKATNIKWWDVVTNRIKSNNYQKRKHERTKKIVDG